MRSPIVISAVTVVIVLALGGWFLVVDSGEPTTPPTKHATTTDRGEHRDYDHSTGATAAATATRSVEDVTTVANNLEIPWDIAFLPDGSILATQRPGSLIHVEQDRVIPVEGVVHQGEGGLLGIALHPNFSQNRYVYLYQTTRANDRLENRVVRYTYEDDELTRDRVIIDGIAGAPYHDGGRIEFGPDGYLWVTAGDATETANAQRPQTLAGSIMRINPDGSIPDANPFDNAVYSYGHRNPQGLAWDDDAHLWSTEHGRSGALTGMDEVNLIEGGNNYGWPVIEGDETREGMVSPKAHSGPDVTWAPASAVYFDGSIYFGGLRGSAVYEAVLSGTDVTEIRRHFHNDFGRIRSIRIGPEGFFYITTSSQDGRGEPVEADDRIIRIAPSALK